ncbi:MAG TPA: hypothetical protein DCX06_08620 [Opitutae bacterium]|nr:hypothetical protein [Opitutae bacterium]
MMLKKRNPITLWLVMLFTGGIFGIIWIYLLARDSKLLAGEERIKIKKNVLITIGLFVVYAALFALNLQQFEKNFEIAQAGGQPEMSGLVFFMNFLIGLAMMGHLISVLLRSANIARSKVDIPSSINLGVFMMIYMISLPILQSKFNKIGQKQSP